MTNAKSPKRTVDRLLDLLAEEVEQQSDAEVLAAALEEGGDVRARASALKEYLLEKAIGAKSVTEVPQRVEAPAAKQYHVVQSGATLPTTVGETSLVSWTNKSVLRFSQGVDPLRKMTETAETIVVKALEAGWDGPPYDPFKLADLLHIRVAPRSDIVEARTVKAADDSFLIEFNPSLPSSRIRFSIAHEIAHTFFPDCLERARYRARRATYSDDD